MNTKLLLSTLAAAGALAACGGGGNSASPPMANQIPPGAYASPEAYTRFVGTLPKDDYAEPLEADMMAAPTSETAEPIVVS